MPHIAVETRSITALKSLVAHSGFLSWMASTRYVTESKAGVFDTLDLPGVVGRRALTAFRRHQGILPSPATKLLDDLHLYPTEWSRIFASASFAKRGTNNSIIFLSTATPRK